MVPVKLLNVDGGFSATRDSTCDDPASTADCSPACCQGGSPCCIERHIHAPPAGHCFDNCAHILCCLVVDDFVSAQLPSSGVPLGIPRPVDASVSGVPATPVITTMSPTAGPVGTTVTINGWNFAGASSVTFGAVAASFAVNTNTSITATVPAGATTGRIAVTTPSGTATSPSDFKVIQPPSLSIHSIRLREGNSGTRNAVFTVWLSSGVGQAVTVHYQTSDETATEGSDYIGTVGVLTFPPYARSRTIAVPIVGDRTVEPRETFLVTLSAPTNAVIARDTGRGTIENDDR